MKGKKVTALLLAAVMTMSAAACGGGDNEPADGNSVTPGSEQDDNTPADNEGGENEDGGESETGASGNEASEDLLAEIIPEETVTLDVYDQLANYSGEQIGWFAQIMLEKFNVKLNIIADEDGVFATRMESGDLGDIVIWGDDSGDYLSAVEKGMLYDWNEDNLLDEYGPYIKEHMPYAIQKNMDNSGGTLYGIGHDVAVSSDDIQDIMYQWDLRWDLYKELGYPEIRDLDDMVEVLAQMKEICPTDDNGKTTYGVSLFNDWDGDMVMFVKSTASAYYGYDEFGIGLYDSQTQTYYPCLEENGPYLTCLKFYNTLYQRGLLDPDSQTQKYDGMVEDFQNGTAFLNVFNFLGSALYNTEAHAAEGKAMYPCPPAEAQPIAYGQNVYGENRPWTIGAKTEYPELCMAIINWLATPEGRMTMEYGPKDVCWYYDENGNTCFTELGRTAKLDGKTNMSGGYEGAFEDGNFKMNNTTWALDCTNPDSNGETFNYKAWASYSSEAGSEIEADWRAVTGCDTFAERMRQTEYRIAPGTTYSGGVKSDELSVVWNQVTDCIKNNSWKAIYAQSDAEFDEIVADMIAQANEYGYEDCIAFQMEQVELRAAAENAVTQ